MSERIFVELPDSADPIPCDIWEDPDRDVLELLTDGLEAFDSKHRQERDNPTVTAFTLRKGEAAEAAREICGPDLVLVLEILRWVQL